MGKKRVSRSEDFNKWYQDLVVDSGMAEHSAVRGCMVIKPYGWTVWETMRDVLDRKFKDTGHVNASFPLLIPKSFFTREASHVEGFAKECAVVTHYRLKNDAESGEIVVDPDARLEEELIIRPTSETIMWNSYRNWIQSHRDLPLLINQWANVMRWEMRTRLFLRTAEFHWQEGHTAHATREEAEAEALQMLNVYADFMEGHLAIPVIKGYKTESERFAGAEETYTVEGLMQDGKALQMGTSHFLGQNFAKAFDVMFTNKEGKREYVWGTSWGVTTRMVGALIMVHSDDEGLVLPPKVAPIQTVIVPIYKNDEQLQKLAPTVDAIIEDLKSRGISVKYDDADNARPGWKFAEYELRGVPTRIAIGPRDLENGTIELARRDTKTKESVPVEGIGERIESMLAQIQSDMFQRALEHRNSRITSVDSMEEFRAAVDAGGFVSAHWDGTPETEDRIKEMTKATIRCIPLDAVEESGKCVLTGKASSRRVLFAKAY